VNLALVLVLLASAPGERVRDSGPRVRGRESWTPAFFEAFPASGAGVPAACSTTAPTGAKGETLTFARASVATCTKTATGGLVSSGIANGDLVVLTNNQPRVEYDSAGVLGLLVESSRTNSVLRSAELGNAAWIKTETAGTVTVTSDYATAPDGTTSAERVQFSACPTAGQESVLRTVISGGSGTSGSSTVYLRGTSGSGTVTYSTNNSGGFATGTVSTTCSFVSTAWTRCVLAAQTYSSNAASEFILGCSRVNYGSGVPADTGAADVLVWGTQYEAGAYATSYIPTTSAAVTRSADDAQYVSAFGTTLASGSAAATVTLPSTAHSLQVGLLSLNSNSTTIRTGFFVGTAGFARGLVDSVVPTGLSDIAMTVGSNKLSIEWSATRTSLINNASSDTGNGATETSSIDRIRLCDWGGGSFARQCDGVVSRVCIDPSPMRCR